MPVTMMAMVNPDGVFLLLLVVMMMIVLKIITIYTSMVMPLLHMIRLRTPYGILWHIVVHIQGLALWFRMSLLSADLSRDGRDAEFVGC